jgi:prolyl-tRNA editing enzyme YbaK/EbsC (Cys-tRNA(Pro) deacylase)
VDFINTLPKKRGRDIPPKVAEVIAVARDRGLMAAFFEHQMPGKTSEEAAAAVGRPVDCILKTLILLQKPSGRSVAVILRGGDSVELSRVARKTGSARVHLAKPADVERITGYRPGAVPPTAALLCDCRHIDRRVLDLPRVVGCGGDERWAMEINPLQLAERFGLQVGDFLER